MNINMLRRRQFDEGVGQRQDGVGCNEVGELVDWLHEWDNCEGTLQRAYVCIIENLTAFRNLCM